MSDATWTCPKQPFGHDWAAGLQCRLCSATRTAGEAIVSGLASVRGWSEDTATAVRDAYHAEVLAEQQAVLLVVSRFDVAMEPAPEEEPVLTIGAIAEDARPVALLLDVEDRRKVAGWLAPMEGEKTTSVGAAVTPTAPVFDPLPGYLHAIGQAATQYERDLYAAYRQAIAEVARLQAEIASTEVTAELTVYRAEHPDSGITLGYYGTAVAARAHCEETERRSWPTGTTLAFDWIEDDEDRVAELVVVAGQNEESATGYLVTALEIPSEYDAEADE